MRVFLLALFFSLFSFGESALADSKNTFSPDANVQKVAEAYAQDCVDLSKKQFNMTLDGSDASIAKVEEALSLMHESFLKMNPRPTDAQVMSFAKAFGSYIGEVYRKNHGGTWGIVNMDGERFPGIQTKSGVNFWPWARARNRIMEGPANNVADYYRALLEK